MLIKFTGKGGKWCSNLNKFECVMKKGAAIFECTFKVGDVFLNEVTAEVEGTHLKEFVVYIKQILTNVDVKELS